MILFTRKKMKFAEFGYYFRKYKKLCCYFVLISICQF